jgi:hypothetical protein
MKVLLITFISLIGNIVNGQTTVHGFCTYYESKDTSSVMERYFSTEVYNDVGENVYEKIFPLGNPDSMYNIDYNIGNTNDYIHESVIGTDTARYYYIHDTTNLRSYIIVGTDTSMIYKTTYQNKLMSKSECIYGCEYREEFNHNSFGSEDTVMTIWNKGDTTYSIRVYDDQNRQVLSKHYLKSPDEIPSEQFRSIYDDSLHTQTDIYETPGWEEDGSIEITHFDKNKIPVKKEINILTHGVNEYWLIEYRRE